MTLWSRGLSKSHDKPNSLYLRYHGVFHQQTWQGMTYLEGLLFLKSHDPLITWSCKITWQANHSISTTTIPMVAKRGSVVNYLKRLLPIKSNGLWVTWFSGITWQIKNFYLHCHGAYCYLTWQDNYLPWGTPSHEVTWSLDHEILQNHVAN